MRVEKVNDLHILCGSILPIEDLEVGQVWAAADGSGHTVKITSIQDGWVCYTWTEFCVERSHSKDCFSFQCRYSLVLPNENLPVKYWFETPLIEQMWEDATLSTWPKPGKFTAGEYDTHLKEFARKIVEHCIDNIGYNAADRAISSVYKELGL